MREREKRSEDRMVGKGRAIIVIIVVVIVLFVWSGGLASLASLNAGNQPVEPLEEAGALQCGGLLDGPLAILNLRQAQRLRHLQE